MIEEYLDIKNEMVKNNFTYDTLGKGTLFVKHLTRYGDLFWLHILFYPLPVDRIERFKRDVLARTGINESKPLTNLIMFYKKQNGVNLFSNSLVIFGYTDLMDYRNNSEPNPIISNNNALKLDKGILAIGYYSIDSTNIAIICLNLTNGECFSFRKNDIKMKPIKKWESFESMLKSSIEILSYHYDKEGYKIGADPKKPLLTRNKTYL